MSHDFTLLFTYWNESTKVCLIIHAYVFFLLKCIKYDPSAFEVRLFVHVSIIIVFHCIILPPQTLQHFDYKLGIEISSY